MTEPSRGSPWRRATWALLALDLVVGLVVARDYGVTTDETWRHRAAGAWAEAIANGTVEDFVQGHRAHYGVLFDQLGRFVTRIHHALGGTDLFFARHVLCFITAWLGLVGVYRLARRLGSPALAFAAVALLVAIPRYWGSSFANPKDIPFATTWVWAVHACVVAVQTPSRAATLRLALASALCCAVRPLGSVFFLVGPLCITAPVWRGGLRDRGVAWRRALGQVTWFFVIGYALTVAAWPVLWVRPPWHVFQAAIALTHHPMGSRSLFASEVYPLDDAPPLYALGWIAITVPVTTLVLASIGAAWQTGCAWRQRHDAIAWLPWVLVVGWMFGPLVVPMLRRTTLYDTVRQLLFVLPAIAILAAVGLDAIASRIQGRARIALALALGLSYGDVLVRAIRLHPYESLFFNRAVGGLPGADGRFDVAHYSETFAEAFAWLDSHATEPRVVHVIGNGNMTASYYAHVHGFDLNVPRFHYFIAENRQGWQHVLPGRVVHAVEREGVVLTTVTEIDPIAPLEAALVGGAPGEEPPAFPTTASDGWSLRGATHGQLGLPATHAAPPPWIAVVLRSPSTRRARIWLVYYEGIRVWHEDRLVWAGDRVPYEYRATERFPSLVPLDLDLREGDNRVLIDASRIRVDWDFGVYWPADLDLVDALAR